MKRRTSLTLPALALGWGALALAGCDAVAPAADGPSALDSVGMVVRFELPDEPVVVERSDGLGRFPPVVPGASPGRFVSVPGVPTVPRPQDAGHELRRGQIMDKLLNSRSHSRPAATSERKAPQPVVLIGPRRCYGQRWRGC